MEELALLKERQEVAIAGLEAQVARAHELQQAAAQLESVQTQLILAGACRPWCEVVRRDGEGRR